MKVNKCEIYTFYCWLLRVVKRVVIEMLPMLHRICDYVIRSVAGNKSEWERNWNSETAPETD